MANLHYLFGILLLLQTFHDLWHLRTTNEGHSLPPPPSQGKKCMVSGSMAQEESNATSAMALVQEKPVEHYDYLSVLKNCYGS